MFSKTKSCDVSNICSLLKREDRGEMREVEINCDTKKLKQQK